MPLLISIKIETRSTSSSYRKMQFTQLRHPKVINQTLPFKGRCLAAERTEQSLSKRSCNAQKFHHEECGKILLGLTYGF